MQTVFRRTRNRKEIIPAPMLEYMVTYTSSITSVYIEVEANIKFHICLLHLGGWFIQQKL